MKRKTFLLLGIAVMIAGIAYAANPNLSSFLVTANVLGSCNVQGVDFAFGNYDPEVGDVDGAGSLRVRCTRTTVGTIRFDDGVSNLDASGNRRMAGPGTDLLAYNLYSDVAGGTIWGDGGFGSPVPFTGAAPPSPPGAWDTLPIYGRIFGYQMVEPGPYQDTINVSISW